MNEILDLLKHQLSRMSGDGSWIVGAVGGGFSLVIPAWVTAKGFGVEHCVILGILLLVFVAEWLIGGRLAKKSTVKRKGSTPMIDSAIRDFIILIVCVAAYGFDYLLGTGAVIFCLFTFAFIYHNFYSLMANIAVLGWEEYFPIWLLKWLQDEIELKKEKYFPSDHKKKVDPDDQENNVR